MAWISLSRTIEAPVSQVFQSIAYIENMSQALPHVLRYEFLTDETSGVGTRFRETRQMGKQQHVNEIEVTEFVENDRVRYVADTNGTIWDTIFAVKSVADGKTELALEMEAKAHKLMSKLMNPLIKSMVRNAVEKDLELIKTYCEKK